VKGLGLTRHLAEQGPSSPRAPKLAIRAFWSQSVTRERGSVTAEILGSKRLHLLGKGTLSSTPNSLCGSSLCQTSMKTENPWTLPLVFSSHCIAQAALTQKMGIPWIPIFVEIGSPGENP
jgi:hypothetical protein